MDNSPQL